MKRRSTKTSSNKIRLMALLAGCSILAGILSGCGHYRMESGQATSENTEIVVDESAAAAEDGYITGAEAGEAAEVYDDVEPGGSYVESCYPALYPEAENGEEYSKWEEKGYASVMAEPVSVFSADVDTASYSNLRRLIREGYDLEDLPEGAVRIEELLNYFTYDYEEPKDSEPFGVTTQISSCPWNEEAQLLLIGLKTQSIDYEEAPPANLVFLLDVSGSMYDDDKLPLLQESFSMLADHLSEKDKVSIVTYAGEDTVVIDGVSGNKANKIKKALMGLEAAGGTYGSKGIETAYALAEKHFIKGGNNRIILATDGDLNIGLTSQEELEELVTEKKESGIFLSVLGFGTGNLKDNKMETLADRGNGNYAYIDSLREAKKVLVEEMTATLLTICKDVKLQVEFNPSVVAGYRLLGYENRALSKEDFADDTRDAGEIGAGHSVTVLYELLLREPLGTVSEQDLADLKYKENYKKELEKEERTNTAKTQEWLTLSIRYKKPAEDESRLLQYPISFDSYQEKPDEDFQFAAAVAEFGLLASHSETPEDASLKHVKSVLKKLDLQDEYKEEFRKLLTEYGLMMK